MKLALISFTAQGKQVSQLLIGKLAAQGYCCCGYLTGRFAAEGIPNQHFQILNQPLKLWVKEMFKQQDGIVFIGAAGIAVRLIAPHLSHKSKDPAVVVVDDGMNFSISLLSGHLGGANELAAVISNLTGAAAVITTSTDVNHKFSVDLFAQKNHLLITDWEQMKAVSAALLEGQSVGWHSPFLTDGELPKGIAREISEQNIWITYRRKNAWQYPDKPVLRLLAKSLVLGLGCRKGIGREAIEQFVGGLLEQLQIDVRAVKAIATIDLKKTESGLIEFGRIRDIPVFFYSADELSGARGSFESSAFVREITGIGNVCERAAVYHIQRSGKQAKVLLNKRAHHGITAALALPEEILVL